MTENDRLAQIIAGCKNGSNESFSQLVDIYATRCFGYFYRLTGNKQLSDDLLSEFFVKLVEKIRSFRGGSFDCWLFKVASNIFYDYLRDIQSTRSVIAVSATVIAITLALTKFKNAHRAATNSVLFSIVVLFIAIFEFYYSLNTWDSPIALFDAIFMATTFVSVWMVLKTQNKAWGYLIYMHGIAWSASISLAVAPASR